MYILRKKTPMCPFFFSGDIYLPTQKTQETLHINGYLYENKYTEIKNIPILQQ